jgi:hypothetical protein
MKRSFLIFCLLLSLPAIMLWSCAPESPGGGDKNDTTTEQINTDVKVVPPGGEVIKDKGDSL